MQPISKKEVSDIRNSQTRLINNVRNLENKINDISNVLTDLQNSLEEKFANATANEHEKHVSKMLNHDNKTDLHDNVKPNQDSAFPHLDQSMEIAIQLTGLRKGSEKNLSNHIEINNRPPEQNESHISSTKLQGGNDARSFSEKKIYLAKDHLCPKGTQKEKVFSH